MCKWQVYVNKIDMNCFLFKTAHGIFKEILNCSLALENNNNGCCLRNKFLCEVCTTLFQFFQQSNFSKCLKPSFI